MIRRLAKLKEESVAVHTIQPYRWQGHVEGAWMSFDAIHNYYEPLVIEYIMNTVAHEPDVDEGFLEDVACLALNQLPPRYVRHDSDMAFSLTTRERERMQHRITEAVLHATQVVREHRRKENMR